MEERKLIVYVDDDEDDRTIMQDNFKNFVEYQLKSFSNGDDFLNCINNKALGINPCLIILDINMPGLNGTDLLKILKNDNSLSDIPVVMFSTGLSPYNRELYKDFNTAVLIKPITLLEYKEVTNTILTYCNR